jgi:hypothetical protein
VGAVARRWRVPDWGSWTTSGPMVCAIRGLNFSLANTSFTITVFRLSAAFVAVWDGHGVATILWLLVFMGSIIAVVVVGVVVAVTGVCVSAILLLLVLMGSRIVVVVVVVVVVTGVCVSAILLLLVLMGSRIVVVVVVVTGVCVSAILLPLVLTGPRIVVVVVAVMEDLGPGDDCQSD